MHLHLIINFQKRLEKHGFTDLSRERALEKVTIFRNSFSFLLDVVIVRLVLTYNEMLFKLFTPKKQLFVESTRFKLEMSRSN